MPRRESSRDSSKGAPQKEDKFVSETSIDLQKDKNKDKRDKKSDKEEKVEKQVKIDKMLQKSPDSSEPTQPSIQDLMNIVSSLDQKFNKLASKDYIEKALDKRLLNLVSEEFLNDKVQSLKADISTDIKSEMDKVYTKLNSVKSKLKATEEEIEHLKNVESDRIVETDKIKEENERLKKRNKELKDMIMENNDKAKYNSHQINELEQYSRRSSVRIYGVNDTEKDEAPAATATAVLKMLNDKLLIKIPAGNIDIAHRMGRFSKDANRPIICKFLYRTDKTRVISARKGLKGTSIVIREDLTLKNARLLEKLSNKDEVTSCWSDEGRIIALLTNGKKTKVDMYTDLSKSLIM